MLHSHFVLLVIFSFFVSTVLAGLLKDDPRGQLVVGAKLFGGFVAAAVVLGWILYPLPL